MLCPTSEERLTDSQGRPYFLWDCDVTLAQFREHLVPVPRGSDRFTRLLL
jgi:hypothetical protein